MNKLAPRASWWILAFLGALAFASNWYFGNRAETMQTKQYTQVKSLIEENNNLAHRNQELSEQLIVTEAQNKKDFMREFQKNYQLQKAFEISITELHRQQKLNKEEYAKAHALIDSSNASAVKRIVTDLIGRADTTEW